MRKIYFLVFMFIFSGVALANSNVDVYIFNNSIHTMRISYQICPKFFSNAIDKACNVIPQTHIIPAIGSAQNILILHGLRDDHGGFFDDFVHGYLHDVVNILNVGEDDNPNARLILAQQPCQLSLYDSPLHTTIVLSDFGTSYITCNISM